MKLSCVFFLWSPLNSLSAYTLLAVVCAKEKTTLYIFAKKKRERGNTQKKNTKKTCANTPLHYSLR
jgi:hypothetical protein